MGCGMGRLLIVIVIVVSIIIVASQAGAQSRGDVVGRYQIVVLPSRLTGITDGAVGAAAVGMEAMTPVAFLLDTATGDVYRWVAKPMTDQPLEGAVCSLGCFVQVTTVTRTIGGKPVTFPSRR